jgi:hypothetical protein
MPLATKGGGRVARPARDRVLVVLLAAAGLLAGRMLMSAVLIPPWQQPDEPGQVGIAEVFRGRLSQIESSDPAREAEILQSMAAHDWWRHYGQDAPPIPARFEGLTGPSLTTLGISFTSSNIPRLYYSFVARVLSVRPRMSVVYDMYVMRALSAVLGMLTLWVAWCAARECLGDVGGATVTALLALHTQFVVVSTAAGPDALVNLAGACLWWQGMRAVRGPGLLWPLVAAWAAALCGAMADRMGVPLLVLACGVSIIAILNTGFRRSTVVLVVSAIGLLAAMFWALEAYIGVFGMYEMWDRVIPVPQAQTWDFFVTFTSVLFRSWWSFLGWLRYATPSWSVAIALVLSLVAVAGAVWRVMREDDARIRMVIGVAVMMVLTEIATVYWVYLRIAHGPQGKHLFPTLIPALVLMWVGIEAWAPARYRPHTAVGVVLAFALLDAVVWTLVAVPAYAG